MLPAAAGPPAAAPHRRAILLTRGRTVNGYLLFILSVLILSFLLDGLLHGLNLRCLSLALPPEFRGVYDAARYVRSQEYLRESTRFGMAQSAVRLAATVGFILAGGFNWFDRAARGLGTGEIATGLVFAGMLLAAAELLALPFSAWSTFVIEQRYGFNTTTVRTFAADHLKGWLLAAAIGAPVLALVLWFFAAAGQWAWLYCWLAVTVLQLVMVLIAPVAIMPLFNTFTPLADGELKAAIEAYAARQRFPLRGVYTMDGSRRSKKANAFFTGLGRFRRIVLLDTLVAGHTVGELVAVLAHEVGHYKKGHVLQRLAMSVAASGLMLYVLSFFLGNEGLSAAFGMEHTSTYATLCFFAFLYAPIDTVIGIAGNALMRRHEFEADRFAARTCSGGALVSALKKLSAGSLANLTPHPAMVFFTYSHPPVLARIRRLEGRAGDAP